MPKEPSVLETIRSNFDGWDIIEDLTIIEYGIKLLPDVLKKLQELCPEQEIDESTKLDLLYNMETGKISIKNNVMVIAVVYVKVQIDTWRRPTES